MNKQQKKKIYILPQIAFVFILTVLVAGYFSFLGVEPHHHGIMMKPALDVAQGKMLFSDTFIHYGALTTIMQSWALIVFGNHLYVINLLTVFFYGLVAVMLWFVWSVFIPMPIATVACAIFIFLAPYHDAGFTFFPWSSVYSLFFQLLTLYALLRFMKKGGGIKWQVLAGVSCALTFWARQPVGFLLTGSIIACFIFLRLKRHKITAPIPFFISTLAVHSFFLGWLFFNNALLDWYYQTIQYPGAWASAESLDPIGIVSKFTEHLLPFSYSSISVWTLMPLAIVFLGLMIIISKRFTRLHGMVFMAVAVCAASWMQYHPVYDPRHWYWGSAPMIGFVFYAAIRVGESDRRRKILLLLCILLFVPDMIAHARLARRKVRSYWSYPVITRPAVLRWMRVPPEEKLFFEEVTDKLAGYKRLHPDMFVTTTGRDALYATFLGNGTNCHKLTVNWDWQRWMPQYDKEYTKSMVSCINSYHPAVVTSRHYYQPPGYVRVTKRTSAWGYYLMLPKESFQK